MEFDNVSENNNNTNNDLLIKPLNVENSVKKENNEDKFKAPFLNSINIESDKNLNNIRSELSQKIESTHNIPYTQPEWSTKPSINNPYFIEIIKNGIIIEKIYLKDLKNETYICVGRFPPCDILLDHPSVSRYHCILQHGKLATKEGWYLYDLGSTHGTRLNKNVIKKRKYVFLQAGYVFQFAGSTRVFSFCNKEQELEENEEEKKTAAIHTNERELDTYNELEPKYYAKDPITWLERFFEREGVPMNFQYTKAEKGVNEWVCSIELPDITDGNLISGTGLTRKLAQFECAMQACHRLDSTGVLMSISLWNKRVTYAENDYYDSDEDTFYDRTGQIEIQRAKRKKRCENGDYTSNSETKTHDDLIKSLSETEEKINFVKTEIQRLIEKQSYTNADGNIVSRPANFSNRMALSQMRLKEKRFIEECNQLKKLIKITEPNTLTNKFPISKPNLDLNLINESENKLSLNHCNSHLDVFINRNLKNDELSEILESEDNESNMIENKKDLQNQPSTSNVSNNIKEKIIDQSLIENEEIINSKALTNQVNNTQTQIKEDRNLLALSSDQKIILPKYGLITKEEARIKKPILLKKRQKMNLTDSLEDDSDTLPNYDNMPHEDYFTWLPPQDQTGDGITKLNKKFEGRY